MRRVTVRLSILLVALMGVTTTVAFAQQKEVVVIPEEGFESQPPEDVRNIEVRGVIDAPLVIALPTLLHDFAVDAVGFSGMERRPPRIEFTSGMPLGDVLNEVCKLMACIWWIDSETFHVRDLPRTGKDLAQLWSEMGMRVEMGSFGNKQVPEDLPTYDLTDPAKILRRLCGAWTCRPTSGSSVSFHLLPMR